MSDRGNGSLTETEYCRSGAPVTRHPKCAEPKTYTVLVIATDGDYVGLLPIFGPVPVTICSLFFD